MYDHMHPLNCCASENTQRLHWTSTGRKLFLHYLTSKCKLKSNNSTEKREIPNGQYMLGLLYIHAIYEKEYSPQKMYGRCAQENIVISITKRVIIRKNIDPTRARRLIGISCERSWDTRRPGRICC